MATVRAFIGVPLPEEYQQRLEALAVWRERLSSRTSWTRPGNWHVTLKFLGDVNESLLPNLEAALRSVPVPSFSFRAGGGGVFPPSGRPRVVWVGVKDGRDELEQLAADIESAVVPLGFTPEDRPFRPHLTVCRVRKAERDDWSALLGELEAQSWPEVPVEGFVLWKSRLRPQGPEYVRLSEYGATSV